MDISDRIDKLLKERGISRRKLAILAEVPPSSFQSAMERGGNMTTEMLQKIAHALGVPASYLMGWESSGVSEIPPGFEPLPKMSLVPRVGTIACGEPILAEQNIEDYDKVPEEWHADFTLVCKGSSMEPRIKNGDIVAIRKQTTVENGEVTAVRIGDEATLKHVYFSPDKLILQPENPAFPPTVLLGKEISTVTIEGKAVGLCRRL